MGVVGSREPDRKFGLVKPVSYLLGGTLGTELTRGPVEENADIIEAAA